AAAPLLAPARAPAPEAAIPVSVWHSFSSTTASITAKRARAAPWPAAKRVGSCENRLDDFRQSRKFRTAHQITIALPRGAPAFVDGPDDQALPAPTVAGGEDTFDAGGESSVLRLDVGARIRAQAELREQRLLRTREAEREQH